MAAGQDVEKGTMQYGSYDRWIAEYQPGAMHAHAIHG
jgi:hypothetical protein